MSSPQENSHGSGWRGGVENGSKCSGGPVRRPARRGTRGHVDKQQQLGALAC
ncbi:hypothetical protein Scep_001816 [Stephania cephalantha]|uniref:Uncharacterized protein n=1 Tax=Stephania cephalantha TaxID=152367 RepID=A0AAP0L9T2_9MAGN